jgi:Domain of unknown function (DUF4202)
MDHERLSRAMDSIDAVNAADPNSTATDEGPMPADLVYGRRMSTMLMRIAPDATEELMVAARAQHIERWKLPRSVYPATKAGYHQWRNEQKRRHAERAAEILRGCGYPLLFVERVMSLIRKENLKSDPDTQRLEDVACLVFIMHYLPEFACKHAPERVVEILRKTWPKLSEDGRRAALALDISRQSRALIEEALTPHPDTASRN